MTVIETKLKWKRTSEEKPPFDAPVLGLFFHSLGLLFHSQNYVVAATEERPCIKEIRLVQFEGKKPEWMENNHEYHDEPLLWADPEEGLDDLVALASEEP